MTGAGRCYIAALIGNEAFKWFVIERDEETIANLIQIECDFWRDYIEKGICPPPDGSKAYEEVLRKKYPEDDGGSVILSREAVKVLNALETVGRSLKALEDEKRMYEQIVKEELGEASQGVYDGEKVVTWKTNQRTTLDTKALKKEMPEIYEKYARVSTSRTFRVCH